MDREIVIFEQVVPGGAMVKDKATQKVLNPTQKPVALYKKLLSLFLLPGELVMNS